MFDTHTKICIDRQLPGELQTLAEKYAIAENSKNAPRALEAAGETKKFWKPGRILRVRFLEGDPRIHAKIIPLAQEWSDFANIQFVFGDAADAEIRIAFQDDGSWSALGTDALVKEWYPLNSATMNYGWLTPDTEQEEYSRVVLHEFGHALGLIHEHQNPNTKIKWNRDPIIKYFKSVNPPWTDEQIEFNIFYKYDADHTQFTAFDRDSIMVYEIPPAWTQDGATFPRNSKLSVMDKQFIAERYPR